MTHDSCLNVLKSATVRVETSAGEVRGTAFQIYRGHFLTAAHVIGGGDELVLVGHDGLRVNKTRIVIQKPAQRPLEGLIWPLPDIGVLAAEVPVPVSWGSAVLGHHGTRGEFTAVGFVGVLTQDSVLDEVRLELEGQRVEDGVSLLKVRDGTILPGLSGSPVLDLERNVVVGFVKSDRGDQSGGFLVSTIALAEAAPEHFAAAAGAAAKNTDWKANQSRYLTSDDEVGLLRVLLTTQVDTLMARSSLMPDDMSRERILQPIRIRTRRTSATSFAQNRPQASEETIIWDPLRSPWTSVGVVGSPGMGKSWMMAHHAASIAKAGLAALQGEDSNADRVSVPLLASAPALAKDLPASPTPDDVMTALGRVMARASMGKIDQSKCDALVRSAFATSRLVLVVDGLDEVSSEIRTRLSAALSAVQGNLKQLIVSTRESTTQMLTDVFPRGYQEFEIVGFTYGDVRRFSRIWFQGDEHGLSRVGKALSENPSLYSLARVPLLLGFICRLCQDGVREVPKTRSGLYSEVALGLLSGQWREEGTRGTLDPDQLPDPTLRLRLLAGAAGHLMATWRTRSDEVLKSDLLAALRAHELYSSVAASAETRWKALEVQAGTQRSAEPVDYVVWELVHDGFLVPGTSEAWRPTLRFLHMVFAELCLAIYLAYEADDSEARRLIAEHRWFDPEWADVFPLACGLEVSTPRMVKLLSRTESDPWLTQTVLEARCVSEMDDPDSRAFETVTGLVGALEAGLKRLSLDCQQAISGLTMLVEARSSIAHLAAERVLQDRTDLPVRSARVRLATALAKARQAGGVNYLISVVRSDPDGDLGWLALNALCESDMPEAISFLDNQFGSGSTDRRLAMAGSLGRGNANAVAAAVRWSVSPELPVDIRVAIVLNLIENGHGEEVANEILNDPRTGFEVKARAATGLLLAGIEVPADLTSALVENPNPTHDVRSELVRALIVRGDLSVVNRARELIVRRDVHYPRRFALAASLAALPEIGLDVVSQAATDRRFTASDRFQCLRVLLNFKSQVGVEEAAVVAASNDEPTWLRCELAIALVGLGSTVLKPELIRGLLAMCDVQHLRERLIATCVGGRDPAVRQLGLELARRRLGGAGLNDDAELWAASLDIGVLFNELANVGAAGTAFLVECSLDDTLDISSRVAATLAAAQADPQQDDAFSRVLRSDSIPLPVRSRIAVALGMTGCAAAFPRLIEMASTSEPAYVALHALLDSAASSREMVETALLVAASAQSLLYSSAPEVWEVDYSVLAEAIEFPAASESERGKRHLWLESELRDRSDRRLLGLLLPRERMELYRVGGMVESRLTRDWLARWVPEYRDLIAEEVRALQALVVDHPELLPTLDASPSTLRRLSEIAALAAEWVELAEAGQTQMWLRLARNYESTLRSDLARTLMSMALRVESGAWPRLAAHSCAMQILAEQGSQRLDALVGGKSSEELLELLRTQLESGNYELVVDVSALGAVWWKNSAPVYFYGALAAAALKQSEFATELAKLSADRANVAQAVQGRQTVLDYRQMLDLDSDQSEAVRGPLGRVPGVLAAEELGRSGPGFTE